MADQPSIFDNKNTDTPVDDKKPEQGANPIVTDALGNLLKDIRNERGEQKYKSVEDALYALKHSQEYIPQIKNQASELEQQNAALRAELDKVTTLEKTVQELLQRREGPSDPSKQTNVEDIAKIVQDQLSRANAEASARSNQQAVAATLQSKFGTDAEKVFYEKAKELGISNDEMNALAAKSPKAVLTMLGVSESAVQKQATPAPTRGSLNTDALQQKTETYIGRNKNSVSIGATSQEIHQSFENAKRMVEELDAQGLTTHDLSDPKVYFKIFGK